jgi:hypothetical protein
VRLRESLGSTTTMRGAQVSGVGGDGKIDWGDERLGLEGLRTAVP